MDSAPLPPHERPWRHPSELGPPEHEPTTTSGRVLIATTAAMSLLLIGLLVVTMTPDRSAAPETAGSAASAVRSTPVTAAALERPALPIVTPVGDEGWAVTTMGAVAGRGIRVTARLPSGEVVEVKIIESNRESGVTVVSLPSAADADGYHLAESRPAPSDTVLVNAEVVMMVEIADLDVDEGTPVLDDEGDLVGICADSRDGVAVRTVETMPDDAAPPTSLATPSTVPSTTVPPTETSVGITTAPTNTRLAPTTTVPSTVSGGGVATTAPR